MEDLFKKAVNKTVKEKRFKINGDARAKKPKEFSLEKNKMIPVRWKVVEHQKNGVFQWDPKKISLFVPEEQESDSVSSKKLKEIFKEKNVNVLNSNLLFFLEKHQELIPEDWRNKAIIFWGTIYEAKGNRFYVLSLKWQIDRYAIDYMWVNWFFNKDEPSAILVN
ncbi:MAG: hypothetical protein PHR57_00680 [Patescibacteria group bacterium]|nr:hypothetical protein [Patescibacteria group bacterium]